MCKINHKKISDTKVGQIAIYIYLVFRVVSVSKRFSWNNNKSKSLFSHSMTKYFKVFVNVFGFTFFVAGLHLPSLLKNKQFLMCIFRIPILRTPFSLKNM